MVETLDEDETDEEEEDEGLLPPSGSVCAICQDEIKLTEEVFLMRVVHPFIVDGQLSYFDAVDENDNYMYQPVFFEFECWEREEEDVQQIQQDVPPVPSDAGIILCDICESDICPGEAMGLIQFGEIRRSKRMPNNQQSVSFEGMADPQHVCIACLSHLEDNQEKRIWENEIEPVPGLEVCVEGLHERCWRGNECHCPKRITAS